jgi:hypothetical protein
MKYPTHCAQGVVHTGFRYRGLVPRQASRGINRVASRCHTAYALIRLDLQSCRGPWRCTGDLGHRQALRVRNKNTTDVGGDMTARIRRAACQTGSVGRDILPIASFREALAGRIDTLSNACSDFLIARPPGGSRVAPTHQPIRCPVDFEGRALERATARTLRPRQ